MLLVSTENIMMNEMNNIWVTQIMILILDLVSIVFFYLFDVYSIAMDRRVNTCRTGPEGWFRCDGFTFILVF